LKYHFGPDGLEFNEPVTVRFPYTEEDLALVGVTDPMELEVYYYHTSTGEWVKLEVVDADSDFVYVYVEQFCYLNIGKSTATTPVKDLSESSVPTEFTLEQNFPNPFNPETTIPFSMPKTKHVLLEIFNSNGQRILTLVDEIKNAGQHQVVWNGMDEQGRQVASGIYYAVLRDNSRKGMRKLILLK